MSVLQTGVYLNQDTPLWLSALTTPITTPANIQVSTITTNQTGGMILPTDQTPWPNTNGAQIAFNRITGDSPTELQMTPSKQVPKYGVGETTYLAATTNGGTLYDDIAVNGLQIYGNQLTNPNANLRCAGYLTRKLEDPISVELRTVTFYTSRISSFIMDIDIVRVKNDLLANNAVFSTLAVSSSSGSIGNNIVVSTIKAQSGDISTFTALSVAAPLINSQIINTSTLNVSSFALPGALTISSINASTINASGITASTLNVSSFILPQAFTISSLTTSTINTSAFTASTLAVSSFTLPQALSISSINASTINTSGFTASTLAVSSFTLPSALAVSTINASTIQVGTINSLVGNFSTLNAPGGTNTTVVSTTVAIVKDIFTSTMQFSATLSPNVDLGLGGIIGGLVGYASANTLSLGLGAVNLATGIASLVQARQSGGLNPGQFQTVNGTTQLQFSTIMAANPGDPLVGKFLETDSANPLTTPGNLSTVTNFLGYGQSFVARSVSDPLNLPNSDGAAGKAIQSFGEWTKVLPGAMDMGISTIFNQYNSAYIDFDYSRFITPTRPPKITFGNKVWPDVSFLVEVNGQFGVTQGISGRQLTAEEGVDASFAAFSTLTAFQRPNTFLSTVNVVPGLTTSTIVVSTIIGNRLSANSVSTTTITANTATTNSLSTTTLAVSGAATVGTNLTVLNNANITNTLTATNVNLTNINGVPYSPSGAGMPTGSLMMWPGGNNTAGATNVPPGYLYCDGATYSGGAYPALYAAIGNTWGGTPGVSFRVPDTRGRAAFGSLVDTSSGSGFGYEPQVTFQSVTVAGAPVADTNNGWYVTATTSQVYVGQQFNFAGTTGIRTITKILSNNGIGDGWVTPFVILWSSTGTANAFPVFVSNSVANLATETTLTIAPFIGRQPSDPGGTYNLQAAMGTPGNGQAIDQTSRHLHTYNLGNGRSYNVAGAPDLIADNNGRDTSMPQGLYSYTIPGGAAVTVNHIMLNNPPNFGIFYYIKT